MSDNAVRIRNCCPSCSSVSIVKRKKNTEWHCMKCDEHFVMPVQREFEHKSNTMPPILKRIMIQKKGRM